MDNIRPIGNEADYEWALCEIRPYFDNPPAPGSPEGDRFDVLATLIESYEETNHPIAVPDPVDLIAAYMEMRQLAQKDLAAVLGSPARASEILGRKRALSKEMIYRIHREWGISADLLIQPYELVRKGAA